MVVATVAGLILGLASPALAAPASGGAFDAAECDVSYTFDVRNWVVDYLRPTALPRKMPFDIPSDKKKAALLINDQYPGPLVEATEGDLVCVTVHNNLLALSVSIHMHGQHFRGFPAFDGVYGVTQSGIPPQGGTMTYRWIANSGTHYYHAHMQAQEADKGVKGPVLIHAKEDRYRHMYDEDMVVSLSDDWRDPSVCLRDEGAQAGNPVCAEIEKATFNGVWGDGSKEYPYPKLVVETGKCYRMRFIGMMGQTQNFEITMAGHNMTLIAYDGADVEPVLVKKFNLHAGERADVIVCADQVPGNYLVEAVYDLATFLETAPSPRMPKVDSSKFFAFLNYKGFTEEPPSPVHKALGGYKEPPGTGGGAYPLNVTGIEWNLNKRSSWGMVRNTEPLEVAGEAGEDVKRITLNIGIKTPPYTAGTPYGTADRIYLFDKPLPWSKPATPLLHTRGTCGADNVPFITLDKEQTVEVVINNLTPTAHVLHLHGGYFEVVNYAPFSETWCSEAHVECFFTPIGVARLAHCPGAQLGDLNGSLYDWGCPYKPSKDDATAFSGPFLKKDMISVWRRSWVVIRFRADNPGTWLFHCHAEQHIPMGQVMAWNVLPELQPPVPKDVPTEGPCPVVNPE